ncbi:MAG: ATP-binding protein [Acidimicrobiales bacterium]
MPRSNERAQRSEEAGGATDRDAASTAHLEERIALVVDRLLEMAQADPSDPYRFDPVSAEAEIDRVEAAVGEGGSTRLGALQQAFDLSHAELDVLLFAVAAEIDPEVRRWCSQLQPDATTATVGVALRLLGLPTDQAGLVEVLSERAPLLRHHLVSVEQPDIPLALRPLRVPDRVVRAVQGIPGVDPLLRSLETPLVAVPTPGADQIAEVIRAGVRIVYIRERPAISGHAYAAAALEELELAAVGFDLRRAGPDHHPYGLAAAIAREGGLNDAAVVVGPIETITNRDVEALVPLLDNPWPVILVGSSAWEPSWSRVVPFTIDAQRPEPAAVVELWERTLAARGVELGEGVDEVIAVLRLTPEQTVRAAVAAHLAAAADAAAVDGTHVRLGARTQAAGRLEQLAERIAPRSSFADLVLPRNQLEQVAQVVERGRHRDRVLDEWRMRGLGSRGRGITALFAGDSGTGKTLSAEAIAGELGVDLYVIDLSTVVDKYVGETEKNLGRVFDEAEGINGILFFDEADALFGKRSETSGAHDRYANVEVAYLLQRMEHFDGIAILATNLRSNIDEAFTRRLDIIVHFTIPDVDHRLTLWRRHLPETLPQDDDLDIDFLATRFELSGGVIRNVTLTAAFRAAQRGDRVTMADLVKALSAEYSKMGRLFDTSMLGPHAGLLDSGD